MKKLSVCKLFVVLMSLTVVIPVLGYQQNGAGSSQQPNQQIENRSRPIQVASGQKMKVQGVIVSSDNNGFILRDLTGSEMTVRVSGSTKIEEKKSNPFRSAKKYSQSQLTRALNVQVEGRGDGSGALLAEKIKTSEGDLRVALTVDSQVVPLENRISQTEQNAQRLSGQVDELSQVANLARGGAAAAQESADAAIDGVNKTNDRISSLDDYEVRKSETIQFKVRSAMLSPEAKLMLDDIATQAKNERGFMIEVRGFASSDGSENLNRRLSQQRSEAIVRYLGEQHDIPMRRIILPFGYGEAMPVADNTTLDGRKQNRRAEVKILVSRGLTAPVNVSRPVSTNRDEDK